ncbi:hypothetical protein RM780_04310 [Streptomyces sp. DSM 44917]|uniref:Uncharacterized protein n=1 Tax=Streptomyces boetiae TaxID=3075541 RepID=A0ABU2L3P4_9ACTN|nr:hypothetical protein [Streptomyces sp. DSM 44917]MDT0306186.1 hypothetical protein [Streptomyces sp. DSM 44917]
MESVSEIPGIPLSVALPVAVLAGLVPLIGLGVVTAGARAAGLPRPLRLGAAVAAALAGWGLLLVALTVSGAVFGEVRTYTGVAAGLAWLLPSVLIAVAARRVPALRAALGGRAGPVLLTGVETARCIGAVFLILHGRGDLPSGFALPAAWGDIAVGATAPLAAWVAWARPDDLLRPGSGWRRAFLAWQFAGLADMWMAVTLGRLHAPGAGQVFEGPPDTAAFLDLPMLLFPGYLVPFATALHYVVLAGLLRPGRRDRPGRAPGRGLGYAAAS